MSKHKSDNLLINYNNCNYIIIIVNVLHLNRDRETCGSWLGPSHYFEVYNYEGNLIYKVQGPSGYPCECTRDSVAVFKVQ